MRQRKEALKVLQPPGHLQEQSRGEHYLSIFNKLYEMNFIFIQVKEHYLADDKQVLFISLLCFQMCNRGTDSTSLALTCNRET